MDSTSTPANGCLTYPLNYQTLQRRRRRATGCHDDCSTTTIPADMSVAWTTSAASIQLNMNSQRSQLQQPQVFQRHVMPQQQVALRSLISSSARPKPETVSTGIRRPLTSSAAASGSRSSAVASISSPSLLSLQHQRNCAVVDVTQQHPVRRSSAIERRSCADLGWLPPNKVAVELVTSGSTVSVNGFSTVSRRPVSVASSPSLSISSQVSDYISLTMCMMTSCSVFSEIPAGDM